MSLNDAHQWNVSQYHVCIRLIHQGCPRGCPPGILKLHNCYNITETNQLEFLGRGSKILKRPYEHSLKVASRGTLGDLCLVGVVPLGQKKFLYLYPQNGPGLTIEIQPLLTYMQNGNDQCSCCTAVKGSQTSLYTHF